LTEGANEQKKINDMLKDYPFTGFEHQLKNWLFGLRKDE